MDLDPWKWEEDKNIVNFSADWKGRKSTRVVIW